MAESGVPYTLTTNNFTVTFNDWTANNVMQLVNVSGMQPVIRKTTKNRPQRHGISVGRSRLGGMTPTFQGAFIHTGPAAQESMRRQLYGALYDISEEWGVLSWTPSDGTGNRSVEVQLMEMPDVDGGLLKTFQFMLVTKQPFIRGATMNSQYTSFLSDPLGGGLVFPFVFPIDFTDPGSSGAGTFVNAGESISYPVITVYGPLTNPIIRNVTTGAQLRLNNPLVGNAVIAAGETIVIDMWEETIYREGDATKPMMQYLDTVNSEFWSMRPGENVLGIIGSSPDPASTRARFDWWDSFV